VSLREELLPVSNFMLKVRNHHCLSLLHRAMDAGGSLVLAARLSDKIRNILGHRVCAKLDFRE
jgi:hypothetical protein